MKKKSNSGFPYRYIILSVLFFILKNHSVLAQQKTEEISLFKNDQALAQTIVEEVFQDDMGFMWFGTYDGLIRFDGSEIKRFKYNHLDDSSISNDVITSIVQDKNGVLWIGTHMGLNSYDPLTEKFTHYFMSTFEDEGLISNQISSLMIDSNGYLWVSTYFGLSIFDPEKATVISGFSNPQDPSDPNGVLVRYTLQINDSTFLISSGSGLTEVQISELNYFSLDFVAVKDNLNKKLFSPSHISQDKSGKLWLSSNNKSSIFDYETKEVFPITFENEDYNKISYLTSDPEGNIWIGVSDIGFVNITSDRLYKSANNFKLISKPLIEGKDFVLYNIKLSDESGISFKRILSSWFDNSGVFWIGTQEGLFNLDLTSKLFDTYCRFANDNSTKCDDITSITTSKTGKILFGTSNSTLFSFDPQSKLTELLSLNQPNQLMVTGIHSDPFGYIWVALTGGGIIKLDSHGKFVKRYTAESPDSVRLEEWAVWCLLEDSKGNLWVGTASGLEKFKLSSPINGNREFLSKTKYEADINDNGALASDNIWALFEDDIGRIWIGAHMGGLSLYKPETDNFISYRLNKGATSALQSDKVQVIMQDHRGIIWLGTEYGFAAMRCDEKDHAEFRTFTENDGLCNNGITGILEDEYGDLWISTKGGVSRFSPPEIVFDRSMEGKFENYYDGDGLQSNKFNPFAYSKSQTGEMFFGGSKGLNSFFPDEVIINSVPPKVALTGFRISNEQINVGDTLNRRFILNKSISYIDEITLTHKQNAITFEFSALNFASPENINYAWKLEGFDSKWSHYGSNHRFASYTNLPPDEYVFKIKATSSDLKTSGAETSVKLIILTPFWQTWLFRAFILILILWIIVSYFRYRTLRLKRQREILRRQVKERTSELENANLQLETKNEEILSQHEHIEKQSVVLKQQNNNLKLLDEIGQNITSSIRVKDIIIKVYDIVNELMDAPTFHIGIVDRKQNAVSFLGSNAKDSPLSSEIISLDNMERLSIRCINKNKILLMNDIGKDIDKCKLKDPKLYIAESSPRSYIYIPLLSIDKSVSGILVAKSFRKNAFSNMNQDILKNMANYISIALDNAQAYNVIEEKSEELSQMDKIKTRFFTNISHEFRTPLTLILSPVRHMIHDRVKSKDDLIDDLVLVERNAERLLRLINQLLDISKIEGETLKLKVKKGNLVKSIYRIVEPFYLHSNYKNIELTITSEQKSLECYYDYDKIEKILYNILSNAIKYTPENGQVNLLLEFVEEDKAVKYIIIKVSDTGIGIPEAALEKIFERFAQIDNPKTENIPGTGIGLALAKKLVELHKGEISVESSINKGSIFSVKIPVSKAFYKKSEIFNDDAIFEKRQLGKVASSQLLDEWAIKQKPINKKLKTILIIEDNPDICHYLGRHFSKNYNIQMAINGRLGFEQALLINPDLVISDIMMPEMNGIELCKKMKTNEATSHIPIILLTARADEKLKRSGYDTGADDYVIKPFDIDILEKRIKNLIHSREMLKERFSTEILTEPKEFSPSLTDEKLLRKILASIENNISNSDFNIDTLNKEVGISRAQLFRKIKSLTNNQTVSDFIITYRLQRAAQLFSRGHSNVSEVAYNVGFKNTSHFTTRFKKQFGKSPKEFINMKHS